MNPTVIKKVIAQSLKSQINFPQVVGALIKEGVESYHVDMVRGENRYYSAQGDSLVEKVQLPHGQAAQEFSAKGVETAVRKVQQGKSNYENFIHEILAAGCVYYIAYLSGEKVAYFGRNGEVHVEYFPKK